MCGHTSARSCRRWSDASYKPTATAETLTTSAASAMKLSGSRYHGRSSGINGSVVLLSEEGHVGRMPGCDFLVRVDPMDRLIHGRGCLTETSRDQLEFSGI